LRAGRQKLPVVWAKSEHIGESISAKLVNVTEAKLLFIRELDFPRRNTEKKEQRLLAEAHVKRGNTICRWHLRFGQKLSREGVSRMSHVWQTGREALKSNYEGQRAR